LWSLKGAIYLRVTNFISPLSSSGNGPAFLFLFFYWRDTCHPITIQSQIKQKKKLFCAPATGSSLLIATSEPFRSQI